MESEKDKYWVSRQWKLSIFAFVIGSWVSVLAVENVYLKYLMIILGMFFLGYFITQIRSPLISFENEKLIVNQKPGKKVSVDLNKIKIVKQSYFFMEGITIMNQSGEKFQLPTALLSRKEHKQMLEKLNDYT